MLADGDTRAKGIHHCKFDYMPGGYSEVADSTQVRRFFGNRHGTLDKSVEGGGVTTASYRADGHLMSRTDPMGATTVFERDARGRVMKVTDPLGHVASLSRDGNGLPIEVTDPGGGVTTIERDRFGNVTLVIDPTKAFTGYRLDDRGRLVEQVLPNGTKRAYAYDAHGNLASATEPNGSAWRFSWDGLGRLLSRMDPLGAETRYSYSPRGDLTAIRDAIGGVTQYGYDGEGHLTQIVDPKGRVTTLTWGGYHKLCSRRDGSGNEVSLRYNREGELVEVHNERGEVHRLRYDPSGKLIGETTFDERTLRYRNDFVGRVTRSENGLDQVTELTYDLAGQLIKRELPDGLIEAFAYDPRGDLVGTKSTNLELSFERDSVGRIVREAQVWGGKEHWVEIAYDGAGDRTARKTSLGHAETVTRGLLGERARTVLDGSHVVDHRADALGRETGRALPSGGWIQSAYDAMGRLSRRRAGGAPIRRAMAAGEPEWLGPQANGTKVDTAYQYDWDGELIESWDQVRGKTRYQYDPIGQLVAMVPEKARAELFAYDAAGNLREAGEGAKERVFGSGNRLLQKGDTKYGWDGDGRLIEKRTKKSDGTAEEKWRYQWDGAGLLRAANGPGGVAVEFAYDPFARRIQKRVTKPGEAPFERKVAAVTRFVWDGDVLVHEITTRAAEDGDPIVEERTYCFEDDGFEPVAHREAGGQWFHYVNDGIGTPERLVDEKGEVACELRRSAWGITEVLPGARAKTPIRFQGQYEDAETGLCYNRWRYYAPMLGIYVSADPLGLAGGLAFFSYCPNPVVWIDPHGLAGTMKRRRRMDEKIAAAAARGGNQTVRGVISPREARRRCRAHAGPGATHGTADNGATMLTSADGTTRARGASEKSSPHTLTGTQINLESGRNLDMSRDRQAVQSNVHVDVRK